MLGFIYGFLVGIILTEIIDMKALLIWKKNRTGYTLKTRDGREITVYADPEPLRREQGK